MSTDESRGTAVAAITRDFTVATFVVAGERILLLFHRKLGMWLPPGGHIEANELPDEAAVREVAEETGIPVRLVPEPSVVAPGPLPLARPEGIQVEMIGPAHQHIDLIYFAVPVGSLSLRPNQRESTQVGWYRSAELPGMGVSAEVQTWVAHAVHQVRRRLAARHQDAAETKRAGPTGSPARVEHFAVDPALPRPHPNEDEQT